MPEGFRYPAGCTTSQCFTRNHHVAKLGKETATIAGRTDGKNAEKVKALGEALNGAVETHGEKAA